MMMIDSRQMIEMGMVSLLTGGLATYTRFVNPRVACVYSLASQVMHRFVEMVYKSYVPKLSSPEKIELTTLKTMVTLGTIFIGSQSMCAAFMLNHAAGLVVKVVKHHFPQLSLRTA